MRRGGPVAGALSARGFQAAATDSDEETLLAEAFAASLRLEEGGDDSKKEGRKDTIKS